MYNKYVRQISKFHPLHLINFRRPAFDLSANNYDGKIAHIISQRSLNSRHTVSYNVALIL